MKNLGKVSWRIVSVCILLFSLLFTTSNGWSRPLLANESGCPTPSVTVTAKTTGYISFSWGAVLGAIAYHVHYVREEDHYVSPANTMYGTSISFSSLPAGTYHFYFSTVCDEGESGFIVLDDWIF